jgi:hypothetical protein
MTAIGIALMRSLRGGRPTIALTIAVDTNTYDIYTAAVAANAAAVAAGPVNVILTINSGVLLYSTSTAAYALTTGSGFQAGTNILVINNGTIFGCGGKGGDGGNQSGHPANGRPGENGGTRSASRGTSRSTTPTASSTAPVVARAAAPITTKAACPPAVAVAAARASARPSILRPEEQLPAGDRARRWRARRRCRAGWLGGAYGEDTFYGVRAGWGGSNTQNFQAGSPPWINQDWAQAGCNGQGAASHTGGAAGTARWGCDSPGRQGRDLVGRQQRHPGERRRGMSARYELRTKGVYDRETARAHPARRGGLDRLRSLAARRQCMRSGAPTEMPPIEARRHEAPRA